MDDRLRTIVGGRSALYRNYADYPRGVEVLLKKAKVDLGFRETLIQDPLEAASSIGLELSESEKKILAGVPGATLRAMVEQTFVPKHHTRTFLSHNVVAMLAVVLASTVAVAPAASAGMGPEGIAAEDMRVDRAANGLAIIESALEAYRGAHGTYPSTEQWMTEDNPLEEFVTVADIHDPWSRKLHYQAMTTDGHVVGFCLESWGGSLANGADNVALPPDSPHRFPVEQPLRLVTPASGPGAPKVLEASHEDPGATVEWYLDGRLLGRTVGTHTIEIDVSLAPGGHVLLVADEVGHAAVLDFRVGAESAADGGE